MFRIASSLLLAVLSLHTAAGVLNSILPKPVYGVPDGIKYPPPPPDIPPPLPNGPPQSIYGVPDGIRYPPPPPDIPPPRPHKEYGVPILKLGPPKIRYEGNVLGGGSGFGGQGGFGGVGGGFGGKGGFGGQGGFGGFGNHGGFGGGGFGGGHHGGSSSHAFSFPIKNLQSLPPKKLSFLDQIKTKFNGFLGDVGFSGGQGGGRPFGGHSLGVDIFSKGPSHSYGPPQQQYGPPQQQYGPPHGPSYNGPPPPPQYGPPQHGPPPFNGHPPKFHGPPPPNFNGPPPPNFNNGPPPSFNGPQLPPNFGHSSGPGPQQLPPISNGPSFNGPAAEYGPPPLVHQYAPSFSGPSFQSNPGKVLGPQFGGPINAGPPTTPLIKCDGWKPIAGPVGGNIGGYDHGSDFNSNDNYNLNVNYDNSDIITHSDLSNLGFGNSGDYNVVKSEGIEFHQTNSISDSFPSGLGQSSFESNQLPPPNHSNLPTGSYLPPSRTPNISPIESFQRPQTSYGPPPSGQILTPPSGIYGVPPGGQYQGLAISHGSVSGNLKPWPVQGEAPKRPIPFKQPLPQGLIESIGETVKQIDSLSSGYNSNSGYEIQQSVDATGGLYSLPLENSGRPFYQAPQISQDLQLPLQQSSYQIGSLGGNTDCNHGLPQDSYGPPPSGRQLGASSDISSSVVTSYIPPPSGQLQDNNAAGSNQIEQLPQASALRSGNSESSATNQVEITENQKDTSISTASSSDSFTIPVQGQLGSYQLQFQSANGLGGSSDGGVVDASTHEQLLSEGLLQQILSAIEHPNQSNNLIVPQTSYDEHISHQDAADFLHSQEGHETLAEPKTNIN